MAEPKLLRIVDSLRNAVTGMGTRRDVTTASAYMAPVPLTQDQIDAAYRGSGLMRKIVNIPALDMVREWRDWKLESEQITALEAEERRLSIPQKVKQAEVLRRLGGGAMILGLPGEPSLPAPANPSRGGLAYVHVVSRWHLSFESLETDLRELNYGEPTMWTMSLASGVQARIHPSRVIPFRADTSAYLATRLADTVEGYWGESIVAQVLEAVEANDTARSAFKALMHKARVTRVGIPQLLDIVSTSDGERKLQTRLEILRQAESIHNLWIYDSGDAEGKGGEAIEDAAYDFTGAKDMLNAYGEFVAAISDIPATRLLGRAPEGMNASGDSQQKDWNKRVRAEQTLTLSPCMDQLDNYLIPSAIGEKPDSQWWDWAPLDTPNEKETAEQFKIEMEAIDKLQTTGAIPEQAFSRGVQSLMIDRGYLPELEAALLEIPEDERWGIVPNEKAEGGDPDLSAGEGEDDPETAPPRRTANDAEPISLYVSRKLLNASDLIAWAKAQGFETTLPADDMHVTVLYSRARVDPIKMGEPWGNEDDGGLVIKAGGPRAVERLGEDAIALLFASSHLTWRHKDMVEAGASHDWPDYQPHITLTQLPPDGFDPESIKPYSGELRFGPEIFTPLDLDDGGSRTSDRPFDDGYSPHQPRGRDGRWIATGAQFANLALSDRMQTGTFVLGSVSNKARAQMAALGVRSTQKSVALEAGMVRHSSRRHSTDSRGQQKLTADDFGRVREIFNRGVITRGTPATSKSGSPRLHVKATVKKQKYEAAFEARKYRVVLVSLRKKK